MSDESYRDYVKQKLGQLTPIFAKAAIGDFSENLPIPDQDDEFTELFVGIQVILEVIREQLKELSTQKIAAEKLAAIVESTDEAITGLTVDGIITSWNKGAEKIYGYTTQEMIGTSYSKLIPPQRQEEMGQILEKMSKGVSLEHYETIRIKKNGSQIDVAKTLSPIRDANGTVIAYSAIATDISFRKKAESLLIESTEKLEQEKSKVDAVLTSIGDGVFAVDHMGNILFINTVAEHITGYNAKDAVGKSYHDIFHFQYENDLLKPYPLFVEDVIASGQSSNFLNHTVLVDREGKTTAISFKATPIKDEQGKIFGCVVVVRDYSRERALEQAKDEFISIAAHQLRTPLGIMRWSMEMLLEGKTQLPDTLKSKIQDIYQSNQRMIGLVNDLLNVSRIQQGRVLNEPAPVHVIEEIKSLLVEIQPEAVKKSLNIHFSAPDQDIPVVTIDPKRFHATLQNILSNALKYNTTGGDITITVTSSLQEVTINIADSGIGIPAEDQKQIFSKFFRATNAALSLTDGSGLGLFIVKSYVEGWGGKVWFESPTIETYGTTVHFTIPMI